MSVTAAQMQHSIRHWASGVAIVTSCSGNAEQGLTATSFALVSLDPPKVLVCIPKKTHTHSLIDSSKVFALNILSADQANLAKLFAKPGNDGLRFEGLHYWTGNTGCPILRDTVAGLDCKLVGSHNHGDHVVFVGKVLEVFGDADEPLLHYNRGYRGLREADSGKDAD